MAAVSFDTGAAWIPPLTIAIPVIGAAVLLVAYRRLPRAVSDVLATSVPGALVVLDAILLEGAAGGRVVTWSAGWLPQKGFSVGIVLVSDPLGAGLALLAAALTTLALLYSWQYVDSAEGHYHCLILLFLAGMEGFALTGDLFDMFVFFELMGAAAYALTGMKVEDEAALQGGMNFGILNSLGAYIALMGVGILYARTGNLGLPQIGTVLDGHRPDALVVAAFVLVMAGFLVKAAMAPFHFWLADAHAVAPSPVCLLFSGVMVPLGVYAAFRVYWVVFSGTVDPGSVRHAFLVLGTLTAAVGALMSVQQRNFKRLLAYSTISHVGLFLLALGTMTAAGTAGAGLYVAAHAGVKGELFLLGGIVLNRYGSVDEHDLHGRGRDSRWLGVLAVGGGLALACLPPFGTALGKSLSEDAASSAGYPWVTVVFVMASGITGGAVLRAAGRIFFGLGPARVAGEQSDPDRSQGQEEEDTNRSLDKVPVSMAVPVVVLLAGALAMGVLPGIHDAFERAGNWFVDAGGYRHAALDAKSTALRSSGVGDWNLSGVLLGFLSVGVALLVAGAGLSGRSLRIAEPIRRSLRRLSDLHSGHIGDYVAWLAFGLAALAGLVGL